MAKFVMGLDLGQAQDYTAVCVIERGEERTYAGRHLERFKLGTPYPAIVARLVEMVARPPLAGDYTLVADQTGVGAPVCDLLRAARLQLVPVTITGGDRATREGANWHVPKIVLISSLQIVLQSGRLKFAGGLPEVKTLVSELMDYRVKITDSAHATFNAREGAHDDLVLAVALAAWYLENLATYYWTRGPAN